VLANTQTPQPALDDHQQADDKADNCWQAGPRLDEQASGTAAELVRIKVGFRLWWGSVGTDPDGWPRTSKRRAPAAEDQPEPYHQRRADDGVITER
jgi:hypothetical protein